MGFRYLENTGLASYKTWVNLLKCFVPFVLLKISTFDKLTSNYDTFLA